MASGRVVHYIHKRTARVTQQPLSKDVAIVYVNATMGLILASKYLPENMVCLIFCLQNCSYILKSFQVRSIYELARKFDTLEHPSPLNYVYLFVPFYLVVAPKVFLADFVEVTLNGHSLLVDQVKCDLSFAFPCPSLSKYPPLSSKIQEILNLSNSGSLVSQSRCITLFQAAFQEFRDRRVASGGNCDPSEENVGIVINVGTLLILKISRII